MATRYLFLSIIQLLFISVLNAQDMYKRNNFADVEHYVFHLSLNDENNEIKGKTEVKVTFEQVPDTFALDLVGKKANFGMDLIDVRENNKSVKYSFKNNKIYIFPSKENDLQRTYNIKYIGVPERGLVIAKTKFGQRSFFGDNWPNLARHWLPTVDHPYDKASVEFNITAPDHYDVVATGVKVEESDLDNGLKLTRYLEKAPVAMKVVTIGVTKFAVKNLGYVGNTEVSAWVYPENRYEGFSDFEEATKILSYFVEKVGPYSYAKLANMQVKTVWGGLENAGTISYNEKSITGKREIQALMAHEIAHQWFGNSATEDTWNHVWLSEGFATYFAILYQESVDGNEKRKIELIKDRAEVIEYYGKKPSPIVDMTIKDPKKVLSRNTYQKGGWVLNMLRHRLGDEVFWQGIRTYYQTYKDANVMSADFQKVMEETSGEDLESFFEQWLYVKGYPEIKWKWKFKKGILKITITQKQKHHTFQFPIEFIIKNEGVIKMETIEVKDKSTIFEIELESKPEEVVIDPEVWLLFEEK